MSNWEEIYYILAGELEAPSSLRWIEEAYGFSEGYETAQKAITDARNHLCERFCINAEDKDLEQIMNAVLQIEKDIARRAFQCGNTLAQRRI